MLGGKWCFNLFNMPIIEDILDAIIFVWELHVKCLCIMMPRKKVKFIYVINIYTINKESRINDFLWHVDYHEF